MIVTPRNGDPVTVIEYPRTQFLTDIWAYRPGEHVAVLAPTGWGKTTLLMQLLDHTISPRLPAVIIEVKPRDRTMTGYAKTMNLDIVRKFPPPVTRDVWKPNPRGWILWTKHTYDPARDDWEIYQTARAGILYCYKNARKRRRSGIIIVGDEAAGLVELGLEREIKAIQQRGRSADCGGWWGSQRPYEIPLAIYSQSEHMFLGYDSDHRSRKRFGEIGGVDPGIVEAVTWELPKFHYLYIRRSDRTMCIIGP